MSIFGNPDLPYKTRVSLLEERLASYDEVSKQMLTRLEQAVEKISESNKNISQILIRHEERIDRASEVNTAIVQLITKTENELKEKIEKTNSDIKDQAAAIEDLKKNKWIWFGIITGLSLILGQFKIPDHLPFPKHLSPQNSAEYIRTL